MMLVAISTLVVDVSAMKITPDQATQIATDFINQMDGNPFQPTMDRVLTAYSVVDPTQPVYYIYNAMWGINKKRFVIVAGENSVVGVLAYGDGLIDVNNIPEAMTALLDYYQVQIEQLLQSSGSGDGTEPRRRAGGTLVNTRGFQLLKSTWGQGRPYYYHCPTATNGVNCLTGCGATAMAQVLNYWNYPDRFPAYEGYTTNGIAVNTLPGIDMDWSQVKDSYKRDAPAETDSVQAVAWLMRYVGQAMTMNYGPSASSTGVVGFPDLLNSYGYNAYKLSKNEVADDDLWTEMMVAELDAGRPIIYSAQREGGGGHVFDVDGYLVDNGEYKFHINWGWEGSDQNTDTTTDGFFYLNEFMGQNTLWSRSQGMIIGIDNIARLSVDQNILSFEGYLNTVPTSQTLTLTGNVAFCCQGEPVSLSLEGTDAGEFEVSAPLIEAQQTAAGAPVTMTYTPTRTGDASARLVISSAVADTVITVNLNGHSEGASPRFTTSKSTMSFTEYAGYMQTQTFIVKATQLTDNINVAITGDSKGYLSVSPTVIPREAAMSEEGVTVSVVYYPTDFDNSVMRIRLTSSGSTARTIRVNAQAYSSSTVIETNQFDPIAFLDGHKGYAQTQTIDVTSYLLYQKSPNQTTVYSAPIRDDLSLLVVDENGDEMTSFTVSPSTISPAEAFYGVPVTVTYNPQEEGDQNGYLLIYCPVAEVESDLWTELYGHAVSGPRIGTSLSSLDIDHGHTGYETTRQFDLSAFDITGEVHLSIEGGDSVFSISPTVIAADHNTVNVPVTVTYSPEAVGEHSATIVLAAPDADTLRLPLTARAISTPCVETSPFYLEFNEFTGYSQTQTVEVHGYNINGDVTVELVGDTDSFDCSTDVISADSLQQGAVPLDVTFTPHQNMVTGDRTASLILSSPGVENDEVYMTGHFVVSDYYINTDSIIYNVGHGDMDPDTLCITIYCSMPNLDGSIVPYDPWTRGISAQEPQDDSEPSSSPVLGANRLETSFSLEAVAYLGVCFSLQIDGDDAADFSLCDSTAVVPYPKFTINSFPTFYSTKLPSSLNSPTTLTNVTIVFDPRSTGVGERSATLHIKPEGFIAKPLDVRLTGHAGLALPAWTRGDVNNDRSVDINDVTALIQAVLTGNHDGIIPSAADVDDDQEVDINDVTELIHFVLTGSWSEP